MLTLHVFDKQYRWIIRKEDQSFLNKMNDSNIVTAHNGGGVPPDRSDFLMEVAFGPSCVFIKPPCIQCFPVAH